MDTLNNKGHKWKKLDKCRPAKKDALALPITGPNGNKIVCYSLVPAQAGVALKTSTPVANHGQAPSPNFAQNTTPAVSADQPAITSGIVWQFSNF